jgi:hypothetical protein
LGKIAKQDLKFNLLVIPVNSHVKTLMQRFLKSTDDKTEFYNKIMNERPLITHFNIIALNWGDFDSWEDETKFEYI